MTRWSPLAAALLVGAALPIACGSRDAKTQGGQTTDGSTLDAPTTTADSAADGSADDEAQAPLQAYLRIAHVAPSMPPIDVCVAPHGTTTFQGPLVGQLAASLAGDAGDDAGAPGLTFAQVSAYLPLDGGQYDVRIVAAGATSCDAALSLGAPEPVDGGADDAGTADAAPDAAKMPTGAVPDVTGLPAIAVHTSTTLLVAGGAASLPNLTVTMLTDDAVLVGGAASLRAINATVGVPSLDFGMESSTQWLPLLTDVAFAAASTQTNASAGAVDANGYLSIGPWSDQTVAARVSSVDASSAFATATGVSIELGSIVTVIAVGGGDNLLVYPPGLLFCTDNAPSGGLLSDCSFPK